MSSTTEGQVAAFPPAAKPEPREARKPGGRYLSFDILRALAILVMIVEHFTENWSVEIAPDEYANYIWFMGQLPPAFFVFLVGASQSLWLGVQKRAGRTEDEIFKYSFRRGLTVLGVGYAVNVFLWNPETTFDWDILLLIGATSLILVPMRNWRPSVLIGICIVILFASPVLRDLANFESYWDEHAEFSYITKSLTEVLLAAFVNGHFPILPWAIFTIGGFAVGKLFYRDENRGVVPRTVLYIGIVLLVIALLGLLINMEFKTYFPDWVTQYYATDWPAGLYPFLTVQVVGWIGITMIALWILNRAVDINPKVDGSGRVLTFFQRYSTYALTAYVVHLAVSLGAIYAVAMWWGLRLDYYFGNFAPTPIALASAVIFMVVFYAFLIFVSRHKRYTLENFIRWISS